MNINEIGCYKNILLLQGPRGGFFSHLGRHLTSRGCAVYKVNFNGGDELFYPLPNTLPFRGKFSEWELFLARTLNEKEIKAICLFGDCRSYHQVAIRLSQHLGIAIYVFEEGYIRPDYITFEKYGVNGRSQIPCSPAFYKSLPEPGDKQPLPARSSFRRMAVSASAYQIFEFLMRWRYPSYQCHKNFSLQKEAFFWVRAGLRKSVYRFKERGLLEAVSGPLRKKYFLVPLQVYNDSQVVVHSKYRSVEAFIAEVIQSFAKHAEPDHFLILKHHPFDRGHTDYTRFIESTSEKYHVRERIKYVHDVHLPTLLRNALGAVVINSTVGMSSLHHNTPVKVMGTAVYDIAGLTHQRNLDTFWRDHKGIDRKLYRRFRDYIIQYTQINGSFYGLSPFETQADRSYYPTRSEEYAKSGQTT